MLAAPDVHAARALHASARGYRMARPQGSLRWRARSAGGQIGRAHARRLSAFLSSSQTRYAMIVARSPFERRDEHDAAQRPWPDLPMKQRILALLLLSGIGFWLTSTSIRALMPLPSRLGLRAKLETWYAHRSQFDVVFVGSSTIIRGVRPEVVDPLLGPSSSTGRPRRSFNLALPGMFAYETDAYLEWILDRAPENLELIVIEFPRWYVSNAVMKANAHTERNIRWHTPRQTLNVLESIRLDERIGPGSKLALGSAHIGLFGRWLGNVGLGAAALAPATTPMDFTTGRLLQSRGWIPLEFTHRDFYLERQRAFMNGLERWNQQLAQRRRRDMDPPEERELARYNRGALAAQVRRIERSGLRVVYLAPPISMATPITWAMYEAGVVPDLIDLNRADRYPALFTAANRFDESHLSIRGATLMSSIIGRELGARLREGEAGRASDR